MFTVVCMVPDLVDVMVDVNEALYATFIHISPFVKEGTSSLKSKWGADFSVPQGFEDFEPSGPEGADFFIILR